MPAPLYPAMLRLEGRRCLVLGTGREAGLKATALEQCGAQVERRAEFEPGCLAGCFLAIAACEDRTRNAAIHAEAEQTGVLLNSVDDPEHCSFILPSVVRRDDLLVAISTSGACPTLAVRLREKLEVELGPEYAEFLALARKLRPRLAVALPDFNARRGLWRAIVDSNVLDRLKHGDHAGALTTIEALIAAAAIE